ncbi:MAG: hypothetical protein ACTSPY_18005 [Candidatus Helarchaeota archaeon]
MMNNWLLRLAYDNSELAISDHTRYEFENDKNRIDDFFLDNNYHILRIDVNNQYSYKVPNKNLYILGKDFFQDLQTNYNQSNTTEDVKSYLIEAADRILMSLKCIKDLVQEIGGVYYINPYTYRLKSIFELLGFDIKLKKVLCEGGLFLKGNPINGEPFLIVSHDLIEHFEDLKITILKCPPDIGTDPSDTHIDTYLGIINFKEMLEINKTKFNGILYIHSHSLNKIESDPIKQNIWKNLLNEMKSRGYLVRKYTPTTPAQNIGINFKFDTENNSLLTNAFPLKERKFLTNLGITIISPEYNFSTNDSFSGGINCSYIFIPNNEKIHDKILNRILNNDNNLSDTK